MSKYKGRDGERVRGNYKEWYLLAENVSARSPPSDHSWFRQLENYFDKAGTVLESGIKGNRYSRFSWSGFVAHYGGSTVFCKYYYESSIDGIVLQLVSNDDQKDITERLVKRFLFLRTAEDDADITLKMFRERALREGAHSK